MANAKEQAKNYLGDIRDYVNYAGYQTDINNAKANYENTINSLRNTYNNLVNTINNNRTQLARDFTSGRSTVANEYYANRNLKTGADVSNYLKGTGVGSLNRLLNRMTLGNENSNLANIYYGGVDELNTQLDYNKKVYDTDLKSAENTLNTMVADANARQKASENAYAQQVATLAEQIQQRLDNNANAKASLIAQIEQYEKQNKLTLDTALQAASENSYESAIARYKHVYPNATDDEAKAYLASLGIYDPKIVEKKETTKKAETASEIIQSKDSSLLEKAIMGNVPGAVW